MTTSVLGQKMVSLLHRLKGKNDPRCFKSTVSWILEKEGWLTPVWVSIRHYSRSEELFRFRSDLAISLPRTQWPFDTPDIYKYELTAHVDELSKEVLEEIISYAELSRTAPNAAFDRHPPRFGFGGDAGNYGWTEKAWNFQNGKCF